jgi:hypothetical protein
VQFLHLCSPDGTELKPESFFNTAGKVGLLYQIFYPSYTLYIHHFNKNNISVNINLVLYSPKARGGRIYKSKNYEERVRMASKKLGMDRLQSYVVTL